MRHFTVQKYIPQDKLAEVRRVMYGHNCGGLVPQLQLPEKLYAAAAAERLDLQVGPSYSLGDAVATIVDVAMHNLLIIS